MQARSKRIGAVVLVGAGPGDPELITLKGLDALQKADVVVYDRLSPIELLSHVREDAQRIFVGKKGGHYAFPQLQINRLLRDKALEGNSVVRLKGGDPFLFGRGAEEAAYLHSEGIPVEVVPGVSSALAAPAAAGIPATHRGFSSSVTILSGHQANGATNSIDWKSAAAAETLIVMMPLRNLRQIVVELLGAGKAGATPAAMVQAGTRSDQATVVAPLENLVAEVESASLQSPALLVVGEVVRLRESLLAAETRPAAADFFRSALYGRSDRGDRTD